MIASQLIKATTSVTAAAGTISSLSLSSNLVGSASVTLDVVLKFGSALITGDYIVLTFSTEFVRLYGTITCTDYTTSSSPVTKTCSSTTTSNVLNSVTITDFCTSCSSTSSYTIRLGNLVNKLE